MADHYHHYLRLVNILEGLKREGDLEMGPKLMDRLIGAQRRGELSPEEVLDLSARVQRWLEEREEQFSSQEFQMKKLLKAMEQDGQRLDRLKKKENRR